LDFIVSFVHARRDSVIVQVSGKEDLSSEAFHAFRIIRYQTRVSRAVTDQLWPFSIGYKTSACSAVL